MRAPPRIDFRNYAGPVARAFELDTSPVSVIIGPTGGGKTQAAARKSLRCALNQHPSPKDGIRKARLVVVCPTYRRAWDTVIPSWLKVWPEHDWGKLRGGKGDPADHVLNFPAGDKNPRPFRLEVLFRAQREESMEEFVRGLETTSWWFPEMDTQPAEDMLSLASNRVGRYPEPDDRPEYVEGMKPAYAGVWGDANAPVIGGWFHKRFYLERHKHRDTDRVFFQPDAFSANAENMHNLRKIRPDYYPALASTMADYDVGRLLRCKPGWSRDGKPVHDEFDETIHVANAALDPDPAKLVEIAADTGNTLQPGILFAQAGWAGDIRVMAEVAPKGQQMDLDEQGAIIRRIFETRFAARGCKHARITVDPSAAAKMTQNRQISYAQYLQAATGIEVQLAPTNDIAQRRTAVDTLLKRKAGLGLTIDPDCVGLIEALAGGYRFKKNGNVYQPQPEKNDHSHIADAMQYLALGCNGLRPGGGLIPPQAVGPDAERVIYGD